MSEYIFVTNIFEYSNIFVTLWFDTNHKKSGGPFSMSRSTFNIKFGHLCKLDMGHSGGSVLIGQLLAGQ